MRKAFIVIYSWHGNVRKLAKIIEKQVDASILDLSPKIPYPNNYSACVNQVQKEVRNEYHPELMNLPRSIDEYDTIFIGSPIWWHTMAPPISTFIDSFDLTGKIIVPFYSHGGSGAGTFERDMKTACKNAIVKRVFGTLNTGNGTVEKQIEQWIDSLNM